MPQTTVERSNPSVRRPWRSPHRDVDAVAHPIPGMRVKLPTTRLAQAGALILVILLAVVSSSADARPLVDRDAVSYLTGPWFDAYHNEIDFTQTGANSFVGELVHPGTPPPYDVPLCGPVDIKVTSEGYGPPAGFRYVGAVATYSYVGVPDIGGYTCSPNGMAPFIFTPLIGVGSAGAELLDGAPNTVEVYSPYSYAVSPFGPTAELYTGADLGLLSREDSEPLEGITVASLGDSYSSGNGTANAHGICSRSAEAWPELLARYTATGPQKVTRVDLLACSGADSRGSSVAPNREDLPDQIRKLKALRPAPAVVTLTIGGDDGRNQDIGFFNVLTDCVLHNCLRSGVIGDEERWIKNREPDILRRDYSELRAADPSASLIVVGYPHIFAADKRCDRIKPEELVALGRITRQLNDAAAAATRSVAGMRFVDLTKTFEPHTVCSAAPWFVNIGELSRTIGLHDWLHPNRQGQEGIAHVVARAVN